MCVTLSNMTPVDLKVQNPCRTGCNRVLGRTLRVPGSVGLRQDSDVCIFDKSAVDTDNPGLGIALREHHYIPLPTDENLGNQQTLKHFVVLLKK